MRKTQREIRGLELMSEMGGGFAGTLADAWQKADGTNHARLKAAFPELLEEYCKLADEQRAPQCRHMACRHCGQDIEGIAPYPIGEWRDRGNNTHCPTPAGDAGQVHAPYIAEE